MKFLSYALRWCVQGDVEKDMLRREALLPSSACEGLCGMNVKETYRA
jgi:hypothetical protein